MKATWLVSGGAGFIGSNFVHTTLEALPQVHLVVLDKLTYAGRLESLAGLERYGERYTFVQGDICNEVLAAEVFAAHSPSVVVHFAAESHVDRSIADPRAFIETNVTGTYTLLEAARRAWQGDNQGQRFLHISTDEVYGSLQPDDPAFSEETPYAPNSPYAASKAASDHLVRAYHHTYGLPTLTTNCSNNYGPYQFPEKLIPLTLLNALAGKPLPVYGDGQNVRDWLYVEDHCQAIRQVLEGGRVGQTYNIGGECEKTNMEVVETLCTILDGLFPDKAPHNSLITFVSDRPGHDRRYAIDATKLKRELGFSPSQSFQSRLEQTVRWYLDHMEWVQAVSDSEHASWIAKNYATRKAVHP